MKQLKSFIQELGVLSLSLTIVFILVMGLSIAKGWTDPGSNPPAGNVSAPINTGNTTQYKDGNLVLNNLGTFATGLTVNKDLQITNGNFKVNTATKGIQFSDGTVQTTAMNPNTVVRGEFRGFCVENTYVCERVIAPGKCGSHPNTCGCEAGYTAVRMPQWASSSGDDPSYIAYWSCMKD